MATRRRAKLTQKKIEEMKEREKKIDHQQRLLDIARNTKSKLIVPKEIEYSAKKFGWSEEKIKRFKREELVAFDYIQRNAKRKSFIPEGMFVDLCKREFGWSEEKAKRFLKKNEPKEIKY